MSETRVGEPSKRRKVVTTIIGLVVAPIVICVSLVIGIIIFSMVTDRGMGTAYFGGNFTLLIGAVIYGGTFGLVPSVLVALPLHHYFVRKQWNSAIQHGALGVVAGVLSLIIFMAVMSAWMQGPSPFMYPGAYIGIAAIGIAGIPGGLAFWIIRRPDRDAPPIPDEVFA